MTGLRASVFAAAPIRRGRVAVLEAEGGDAVTHRLVSATRNGAATDDFGVFTASGTRWVDSNTATTSHTCGALPVGTHAHADRAAEEPGAHVLGAALRAAIGGPQRFEPETRTFVVTG
ncbi:hypothetical protein NFX46_18440 [Streptomyces phaeoluteigriseus]|uniref:Uncharacterized protein n=1 Tax=Streptomyces phaeoluteigriseus TaxID=114686 RepID=A0ABY4ZA51_9ACTN|nr:hypothetical protein [Streptomyces phaeoluteigriseus]USQ85575.1 hypothetical protein NFX46_18440 [Streptomyces phaeoluteigriseus]